MTYATAPQFFAAYGPLQTAALLTRGGGARLPSDPVPARLDAALLERAIGGDTLDDQAEDVRALHLAAVTRLLEALDDATRLIDGYLLPRVTLPLAADVVAANPLALHCRAIARHLLADSDVRRTDAMEADYQLALAWLRDVAAGRVRLIGYDAPTGAGPAGPIVLSAPARSIDWDRY